MKKVTVAVLACGLVALAVFTWKRRTEVPLAPAATKVGVVKKVTNSPPPPVPGIPRPSSPARITAAVLSADEKAARIEKIKRDYDEIRAKASADYSAAGNAFPGGLNAFLRQLALLEREKRADFAAILSPRELEDLELRETSAGQLVQKLLATTGASEEQRRAVFRLQREFEDRFALTFDVTPAALFEREAARQQTQEKIRVVLGDVLFGAWLSGEGEDYASFAAFATQQNLPPAVPLELWRAKNEFTLRRLELATNAGLAPEQRATTTKLLVQQTEARVLNAVGAGAWQAARADVLRWLPRR